MSVSCELVSSAQTPAPLNGFTLLVSASPDSCHINMYIIMTWVNWPEYPTQALMLVIAPEKHQFVFMFTPNIGTFWLPYLTAGLGISWHDEDTVCVCVLPAMVQFSEHLHLFISFSRKKGERLHLSNLSRTDELDLTAFFGSYCSTSTNVKIIAAGNSQVIWIDCGKRSVVSFLSSVFS